MCLKPPGPSANLLVIFTGNGNYRGAVKVIAEPAAAASGSPHRQG
jgi:hypothetical protein